MRRNECEIADAPRDVPLEGLRERHLERDVDLPTGRVGVPLAGHRGVEGLYPPRVELRAAEGRLYVLVDRPRAFVVGARGDGGFHGVPDPLLEVLPDALRADHGGLVARQQL